MACHLKGRVAPRASLFIASHAAQIAKFLALGLVAGGVFAVFG